MTVSYDKWDGQAYLKPPAVVELTLAGVMTVLRKPVTWEEAKKQLGDSSFMESLLRYNRDLLDDVLLKKINRFTTNPDFEPEVQCAAVLHGSPAAGGIRSRILIREGLAIVIYHF